PAYQKGDTVYLEGSPYEITGVSTYHVELLPPGQAYPVFHSEPKERFECLLTQDERNAHVTDFLPEPPEIVNADLREGPTMEQPEPVAETTEPASPEPEQPPA